VSAAKWALTIEQGATFQLGRQLSTGGTVADGGTAINLTDYVVRMHIRKRLANPDPPLLDLSTVTGHIVITNALEGRIEITIPADETEVLDWVSGVYDLEIESTTGFVRRLLYGGVKVTKEVTRIDPAP